MKNTIAISLLLILSFSVYAQDAQSAGQNLSRADARKAALANSSEIKKTQLSVQSANLDKTKFYFRYLPTLDASVSGSLPFVEYPDQNDDRTVMDKLSAEAGAGLTETITLFDGGKTLLEKELLNLETASLEYRQITAIYSTLDDVDTAFYTCLENEATLESAKIALDVAKTAEATASIKEKSGVLSRAEYLQAAAERTSAENRVIEAEHNVSIARLQLEKITGIKNIGALEKIDFSLYEHVVQELSALNAKDTETLYAKIEELFTKNNPDQKQAALTLTRAQKNLSSSKRDYFPTISASASFDLSYRLYQKPKPDKPLSYTGRVSLTASIPLDFWVIANNVQKQELSLESAQLDYQSSLEDFKIEIRSALYDLLSSARSIIASREAEEYASLRLAAQRELFRLGSASLSNLLDASSSYTTQANAKAKSEYTFFRALSTIRSLCVIEDEAALFGILKPGRLPCAAGEP